MRSEFKFNNNVKGIFLSINQQIELISYFVIYENDLFRFEKKSNHLLTFLGATALNTNLNVIFFPSVCFHAALNSFSKVIIY